MGDLAGKVEEVGESDWVIGFIDWLINYNNINLILYIYLILFKIDILNIYLHTNDH